MTTTFTQTDLIRYVYDEVTETEKQEIERSLLFDNELAEQYAELADTLISVGEIHKEPPQRIIDNILEYASKANISAA